MTYPPMTTWRLFPIQLPSLLLGHLYVLLCAMFGMARKLHYDQGVLCGYWRPWVEKRWDFTTTVGHGMMKASWFHDGTRYHERVHVWQYEDYCAQGLVLGLALLPWIGWQGFLIVWGTSGAPWLLPLFLVSIARWKRKGVSLFQAVYYLCEHERSAYAQTKART